MPSLCPAAKLSGFQNCAEGGCCSHAASAVWFCLRHCTSQPVAGRLVGAVVFFATRCLLGSIHLASLTTFVWTAWAQPLWLDAWSLCWCCVMHTAVVQQQTS